MPCTGHHSPARSIRDLDSKNGTAVGGTAVAGVLPLRDGDRIRMGSADLVFRELKRDRRTLTVTRAGKKK